MRSRFVITLCISFILLLLFGIAARNLIGKAFISLTQPTEEKTVQEQQPLMLPQVGVTTYIYGSKLVASVRSSATTYHYQDLLGSIEMTTSKAGVLQSRSISYPYGKTLTKASISTGEQKYTFTGKEDDGKLMYFGARYYDQRIGRFTSVDPLSASFASYDYAHDNPIRYIDPQGMAPVDSLSPAIPQLSSQPSDISFSAYIASLPADTARVQQYFMSKGKMTSKPYTETERLILARPMCMNENCADIATHMHLDWQELTGRDPSVMSSSGEMLRWSDWHGEGGGTEDQWTDYLKNVFGSSGSWSLKRYTQPIEFKELQPGDLIIFPHHTVMVRGVERDGKGNINGFVAFGGNLNPAVDAWVYGLSENPLLFRNTRELKTFLGVKGDPVLRRFPDGPTKSGTSGSTLPENQLSSSSDTIGVGSDSTGVNDDFDEND